MDFGDPKNPPFSLDAKKKIAQAVRKVLANPDDYAQTHRPSWPRSDEFFPALITCYCAFGDYHVDRWKYSFVELERHGSTFREKEGGRTGNCNGDTYAVNLAEVYNAGGVEGNSQDQDALSDSGAQRFLLPVRGYPVVWMKCTVDYATYAPGANQPIVYAFQYENAESDVDIEGPPAAFTCEPPPTSSSSGSSSGSAPCCDCYEVSTTGDGDTPPITLSSAGPNSWTNDDDTCFINQQVDGSWLLTLPDGSTFTATGPCPPTGKIGDDTWNQTGGEGTLFSIECGDCGSSGSSGGSGSSGSGSRSSGSGSSSGCCFDIRYNSDSHCLEKSMDNGATWTTVVCFDPCGGS